MALLVFERIWDLPFQQVVAYESGHMHRHGQKESGRYSMVQGVMKFSTQASEIALSCLLILVALRLIKFAGQHGCSKPFAKQALRGWIHLQQNPWSYILAYLHHVQLADAWSNDRHGDTRPCP